MRFTFGLRVVAIALFTGLVFSFTSYGDEREEIKLRIQEIKKQAAQLLEEGRKDKAAGLMREQEELMGKLRRMNSEGKAEGRGPSPEELKHRIEEIRKQADRLMDQGQKDKAAVLMREQEELMNILRHMVGEGRAEGSGPSQEQMEKFERAMQKVRHLRIASEHLKHAEMHDMALELMRQAEGIEQDLRNAKEKMSSQPRRDQPERKRDEARGLEDRLNGMQRGLDELRGENQQLRMMIEKIAQGLRQPKISDNSQSNPKQPRVEESMMAFSKRQMARLDKDKSGFLTWDEWIEDRHSFSDVDVNKDSKVDVEEYAIFRNKR
ncbi:MAG: hypothetical protein ACKOOI_08340 [Pirellula sp.]